MTSESQDIARWLSSTSFSLPHSLCSASSSPVFKQTLANKLDHLFEVTTIPEEQKISQIDLPLVNPSHAFTRKPTSIIRNIKTLIKQLVRIVNEYVQAFSFDQYPILTIF